MISDDDFKKLTEDEKEKRRGRYRRKAEIWIIPEEEVDKPIEIDTIQKVEENKLKKIKMLKKNQNIQKGGKNNAENKD